VFAVLAFGCMHASSLLACLLQSSSCTQWCALQGQCVSKQQKSGRHVCFQQLLVVHTIILLSCFQVHSPARQHNECLSLTVFIMSLKASSICLSCHMQKIQFFEHSVTWVGCLAVSKRMPVNRALNSQLSIFPFIGWIQHH
jgi:hypothetical protein